MVCYDGIEKKEGRQTQIDLHSGSRRARLALGLQDNAFLQQFLIDM